MSDVDLLVGETVSEVRFGPSVRIVVDEGERVEPALYVDVGRYTILEPPGMEREQDEAHPEALGPTLALVGKQVQTTSTEGAVLDLRFSDGSRLRFQPSGDFEAWQVVGGDPWGLVWCTTDGEVEASFRQPARCTAAEADNNGER